MATSNLKRIWITLLLLVAGTIVYGQRSRIQGTVVDQNGQGITNVSVQLSNDGTVTNKRGEFVLDTDLLGDHVIRFSHISYESIEKSIELKSGQLLQIEVSLRVTAEQINEIVLEAQNQEAPGEIRIDTKEILVIPSANQGVESILKTLPGVNFNNELSTQYNVRGGSFEENLIYINGIEIYKPFLVRSGQQEGLSFVNPNLTHKVSFSAGGFQAKYGDKMSSVLDITYRKPNEFGARLDASFLGFSASVEGTSKDERFKSLVGLRYRDNSIFLNNRDLNADFDPDYTDLQGYFSYDLNDRLTMDLLVSFANNNYRVRPSSRTTKFGTITDPKTAFINYTGREDDEYRTWFGSVRAMYQVNNELDLSLTFSSFETKEKEYYDILAVYGLSPSSSDLNLDGTNQENSVTFGAQLDHARNDLKARIHKVDLKANYRLGDHLFEFGLGFQKEHFKDRINEWQVIDSAGYSLRPPGTPANDQPYTPFEGEIIPYILVNAENDVTTDRMQLFGQWSKRFVVNQHRIWLNAGLRAHYWELKGATIEKANQWVVSPRAQLSIKPNWNHDMIFRVSGGLYQQPPFYREYRDAMGQVQSGVRAQRSTHLVLGHDYSFGIWGRPFKLVSEVYYKGLKEVNPFTIDNVKIRYQAKNNAVAYAWGADLRLHGEFVPGTESWISIGYLQTEENIEQRGYISRPTDQRLKFGLVFQDYVPTIPSLKMYLNLVYNTGVPGGAPSYADPYDYQGRLPAYSRTDLGISYLFIDNNLIGSSQRTSAIKHLSAGLELFNMFDQRNSITNTWIKDVSTDRYVGVPNYLSGRVLNLRLSIHY